MSMFIPASLCFFFFNDTATTEIYTLSLHDALPILARCGKGPLVGQDAGIRPERLEAEPGEEPTLGSLGSAAGHPVGLLIGVDRRSGVLVEGPIGTPRGERPGRAPVALIGLVAEFVRRQVQTNDVLRMPTQQPAPQIRTDDVVRRGDDERQVA